MKLRTYPDLEQRSPEWYEARCGILTASTVGQMVTAKTLKPAANDTSRTLTAQLVAERITGHVEETYQSHDMLIGLLEEPRARAIYEQITGTEVTEVGFMVREWDHGKLGYSPDGLVGDDGLIEIKTRLPKHHVRTLLHNTMPAAYTAQVQAGLFVSGRQWLDFVSFCGGLPPFICRILPDAAWQPAIEEAVEGFEESAALMIDGFRAATEGLPVPERIDYANYSASEIQVS